MEDSFEMDLIFKRSINLFEDYKGIALGDKVELEL